MPAALMRFDFPAGLPCTADIVGSRSRVHLPLYPAELCMPVEKIRAVGLAGAFGPPRLRGIEWFTKVNDHHSERGWSGWGSFSAGGPNTDSWFARVNSAVLRVPVQDASDRGLRIVALAVHDSIYTWYGMLRDWLETLTHVDLGHEHAQQHVVGRSPVETPWWVATARLEGQRGYELVNPPMKLRLRHSPYIDKPSWQRAVRQANAAQRPPHEHLILRDARAAFNRGLFRRSVLDAATATEIVLSALLEDHLDAAVGLAARERLIPNQIGRKSQVLSALGMSVSANLQEHLFNVRNKAIHRGAEPTSADALRALAAASEVLQSHAAL